VIPNLQLPTAEWERVFAGLPKADRCCLCKHRCYCVKKRVMDMFKLFDGRRENQPQVGLLICDGCAVRYTAAVVQGNNVVVVDVDSMKVIGRAEHWCALDE
jgi:hypothetical protein